jgi:hypothetical protein
MTEKVRKCLELNKKLQILYEEDEDSIKVEYIEDVLDSLWYSMSTEEQDEVRSECGKRANSKTT